MFFRAKEHVDLVYEKNAPLGSLAVLESTSAITDSRTHSGVQKKSLRHLPHTAVAIYQPLRKLGKSAVLDHVEHFKPLKKLL